MPTTVALSNSNLKIRFREPYLSQGLNQKFFQVVTAGVYEGFDPVPSATPLTLQLNPGVDGHIAVVKSATDTLKEVSVHLTGTLNVSLVSYASLSVAVTLEVDYSFPAETTGFIRVYDLSTETVPSTACVLARVDVPAAGVIPAANIELTGRTFPWAQTDRNARGFISIAKNGSFELVQGVPVSNQPPPYWNVNAAVGSFLPVVSAGPSGFGNYVTGVASAGATPQTSTLFQRYSVPINGNNRVRLRASVYPVAAPTSGFPYLRAYITNPRTGSFITEVILKLDGTAATWTSLETTQTVPTSVLGTGGVISQLLVDFSNAQYAAPGTAFRITDIALDVEPAEATTDIETELGGDIRQTSLTLTTDASGSNTVGSVLSHNPSTDVLSLSAVPGITGNPGLYVPGGVTADAKTPNGNAVTGTGQGTGAGGTFTGGGSATYAVVANGNLTTTAASSSYLRSFATTNSVEGRLESNGTGSAVVVGAQSNHPLLLETNNVERARIDTSGNVGIGTSSPTSVAGYTFLTVQNTASGGIVEAKDATVSLRLQTSGISSGDVGTYSNHPLLFRTNSVERASIDTAGNFGIGVSPATKLDVEGSAIRIAGAASGYGYVQYGKSGTASNNWYIGSEGDGTFRVYNGTSGGTERLRITSSGEAAFTGGNVSVASPYVLYPNGGIDRSTIAALNIGATNANAVNISRTGILTTVLGNLAVSGSFFSDIDSAVVGGTVQVGPTNASIVNIGRGAGTATNLNSPSTVVVGTLNLNGGTAARSTVGTLTIGDGTNTSSLTLRTTGSVNVEATNGIDRASATTLTIGGTNTTTLTLGRTGQQQSLAGIAVVPSAYLNSAANGLFVGNSNKKNRLVPPVVASVGTNNASFSVAGAFATGIQPIEFTYPSSGNFPAGLQSDFSITTRKSPDWDISQLPAGHYFFSFVGQLKVTSIDSGTPTLVRLGAYGTGCSFFEAANSHVRPFRNEDSSNLAANDSISFAVTGFFSVTDANNGTAFVQPVGEVDTGSISYEIAHTFVFMRIAASTA